MVVNPSVHLGSDRTTITDPATLEVMALFDDAFAIVTTLLARFFMHTDQSVAESAAIQRATFFPLMTTVIRPLAEMLTHLPAFDDGPGRAGPSFDLPSREAFLPHRHAAWEVIDQQLRALADRADHLRHDTRLPGAHLTRLDLMWENLHRVARDFGLRMGLRPEDVREA